MPERFRGRGQTKNTQSPEWMQGPPEEGSKEKHPLPDQSIRIILAISNLVIYMPFSVSLLNNKVFLRSVFLSFHHPLTPVLSLRNNQICTLQQMIPILHPQHLCLCKISQLGYSTNNTQILTLDLNQGLVKHNLVHVLDDLQQCLPQITDPCTCIDYTGRDDPFVSEFGTKVSCTKQQYASRHLVAGNGWKCIIQAEVVERRHHTAKHSDRKQT